MNRRFFVTGLVSMILGVSLSLSVSPVFAQRGLPDFTDLVEKAGPAVVNIRTLERAKSRGQGSGPSVPRGMPPG
ncbi:MAG: hypothetical protein ACO3DD_05490, partial [Burkholderiaceae bacterium]